MADKVEFQGISSPVLVLQGNSDLKSISSVQMRYAFFALIIAFVFSHSAVANSVFQESARTLGSVNTNPNSDANSKILTSGEVDTWAFEAAKDEVLIVEVSTSEFDSVIGVAKVSDKNDEVLLSNDDEGSSSRFRYRIREAGTYKIRVHAYKLKGGGAYQLSVQRYKAKKIAIGERGTTKADQFRNASFFFPAQRGQFVTLVGRHNKLIDPSGNVVQPAWRRGVYFIRETGEYLVACSAGTALEDLNLEVRPSAVGELKLNEAKEYETSSGTLHSWEINGQKGQFALITVSRANNPATRVVFAPSMNPSDKKLNRSREEGLELQFLPVANKGESTTYAVVFCRNGKFLLQTYAHQKTKISIAMKDPTIDLTVDPESVRTLKVGDANYFGFDASAGDLVKFDLSSDSFDSVLRLFDGRGKLELENDDFEDSTNSEISFQVPANGYYRWQVSSLGNGGGGEYRVNFLEVPKRKITVGESAKGTFESSRAAFWSLKGKARQSVYLSVRSKSISKKVETFDSHGRLISSSIAGVGYESLVPFTLGNDGLATVQIAAGRVGEHYEIRVMDASWDNAGRN